MLSTGYTDIPPGCIATIVTYLERGCAPTPGPVIASCGRQIERLRSTEVDRFLHLFRTLGTRWLWFSQLRVSRSELNALLDHPDMLAFAVSANAADIGLLQVDFGVPGQMEIVLFGLIEGQTGQAHGRWLMQQALALAAGRGAVRVWLHTCTADHPKALAFYQSEGFCAYRLAVEVEPDPRLDGTLPRSAAPHLPIIAP